MCPAPISCSPPQRLLRHIWRSPIAHTLAAAGTFGARGGSRGDRVELHAMFEESCRQAAAVMNSAYRAADTWLDGVRNALAELLRFLDANPRAARAMVVDSLAGDPELRARRGRALAAIARALDADRPRAASRGGSRAPFDARAVVGAVAAVIHARLVTRAQPALLELRGPLMALIVVPYLDVEDARRELNRLP